jgi:hypothetical protein
MKIDFEEWLIDRLTEAKQIVKVFSGRINKLSDLVTLDNTIHSFNITNEDNLHSLECGNLFESRVSALKTSLIG